MSNRKRKDILEIASNFEGNLIDYVEKLTKERDLYKSVLNEVREYINKYAWQEDIIGGIYTCDGKPAIDRYMRLEWDNCNELLEILDKVGGSNG